MRTITRDRRRAERERTLNRRAERNRKYDPPVVPITGQITGDYLTAVSSWTRT